MRISFLFIFLLVLSFVVLTTCDNIIEDITSVDVGMTENLYTGSPEGGYEYITINQSLDLTKPWPDAGQVVPVNLPSDMDLKSLAEAGALSMNAKITNNNSQAVRCTIYFGNSAGLSDASQAVFIASVVLSGGEAVNISEFNQFDQSESDIFQNIVQFFNQNPGITVFYLYIGVEPASAAKNKSTPMQVQDLTEAVTIEIHYFESSPFWQLTQEIMPDTDYQSYGSGIEAVKDINLTGYIKNNGAGPASLVFEVAPGSSESWTEGVVAQISAISPGDSLVFDGLDGFITNPSLLENAFETLTVNNRSIFVTLTVTSDSDLNMLLDINAHYVVTITK